MQLFSIRFLKGLTSFTKAIPKERIDSIEKGPDAISVLVGATSFYCLMPQTSFIKDIECKDFLEVIWVAGVSRFSLCFFGGGVASI